MSQICFICNHPLHSSECVTVSRGMKTLIDASVERDDGFSEYLRSQKSVQVHVECRKNYTRKSSIAFLKKKHEKEQATTSKIDSLYTGVCTMQDVLRLHSSGDLSIEWNQHDKDIPEVIIHDKLMTDAAFGHATLMRPIKNEHSYSLSSDGGSLPDSPQSIRKDDMEDECFPAISMKKACGSLNDMDDDIEDEIDIKDEPMSETDSIGSSCPASPESILPSTPDLHFNIDLKKSQNLLRESGLVIASANTIFPQKVPQMAKLSIRIEPSAVPTLFHLPPTPPSCSSSSDDSEDYVTVSPSPSSKKNNIATTARLLLNHHTTTRQPIHTHLISSQPKGSTGTLVLTEEEKRTLIAEGYPVPTRLPLSKTEEKSLKKIRRKIKNKISAQESRRKKKEYMDQLERKVGLLVNENNEHRKTIENLQDSNNNLLVQLQKLQALVAQTHPHLSKQTENA